MLLKRAHAGDVAIPLYSLSPFDAQRAAQIVRHPDLVFTVFAT